MDGQSFGKAIAEGIAALILIAFVAGVVATGLGFALWHFVLSHIQWGWK